MRKTNATAKHLAGAKFDYDSIPGDKRKKVEAIAREIKRLTARTALDGIDVGRRLAEVHKVLGPSTFSVWLMLEFGWSRSTGGLYMRAVELFGDLECLEQFQISALWRLGRKWVPQGVIDEMIARARNGEFITSRLVNAAAIQFKPGGEKGEPGKRIESVRNQGSALLLARTYVEKLARNLDEDARRTFADGLIAMATELRRQDEEEAAARSRRSGRGSRSREMAMA